MVLYRILADLVVAAHVAYVAFVVLGQAAILYGLARKRNWVRNFYFRWLHLLTIAIVVVQSWLGTTCPLTDLENYFRAQAGQTGYPGDFIGYWLDELLFFEAPPWVFIAAYTIFGALVLATFVLAPPRWRPQRASPGSVG
jgi:Protein of Unknown function (DUF2784)